MPPPPRCLTESASSAGAHSQHQDEGPMRIHPGKCTPVPDRSRQ